VGGLLKIGKSFGLTEAQFTAALQDKTTLEALNARVEKAAVRDKVEVTPTFFVNGKHEGGQTIETSPRADRQGGLAKPGQGLRARGRPVQFQRLRLRDSSPSSNRPSSGSSRA
jgi:hypothetical protein